MANIVSRYVLDSSALIAFLWDEAGAQTVEDILVEEDAEVFMSVVNLGEVIYIVHRLAGEQTAAAVETKVFETPKLRVIDATWPRVKHAAGIKGTEDSPLPTASAWGSLKRKKPCW